MEPGGRPGGQAGAGTTRAKGGEAKAEVKGEEGNHAQAGDGTAWVKFAGEEEDLEENNLGRTVLGPLAGC